MEADGGPLESLDIEVEKGRDKDKLQPLGLEEPAGHGQRLDSLVHGGSADGLHLALPTHTQACADGTGYRRRTRLTRDLERDPFAIHDARTPMTSSGRTEGFRVDLRHMERVRLRVPVKVARKPSGHRG